MLRLTKLDNKSVLISLETVKYIESTPDTIIFFVNGDSLIVRETLEQIEGLMVDFKKKILASCEAEKP